MNELFHFNYYIGCDEDSELPEFPGMTDEDRADDKNRLADDRPMTTDTMIRVLFEYPLSRPDTRTFVNAAGFTKHAFAQAVAEGYRNIYREEDAVAAPTGHGAGILNRGRTEGPYGIWGHGIDDLILEGARLHDDGVWHIGVGS